MKKKRKALIAHIEALQDPRSQDSTEKFRLEKSKICKSSLHRGIQVALWIRIRTFCEFVPIIPSIYILFNRFCTLNI